jgi:hypothetical protein
MRSRYRPQAKGLGDQPPGVLAVQFDFFGSTPDRLRVDLLPVMK